MCNQCPPTKRRLVAGPEILEDLDACCSSYEVEETDSAYTLTLDPGDGTDPVVFEIPKCTTQACSVNEDGDIVMSRLVDGEPVYTLLDGTVVDGPGVLV